MKRLFLILLYWALLPVCFAQKVDFTHLKALLRIDAEQKEISGDLIFTFDVLSPTDSVRIDAQKMEFQEVFLNGQKIPFQYNDSVFWIKTHLNPSRNNQLQFSYTARPKQTMYFIQTSPVKDSPEFQFWTQGQGKYTSHWLPSFDDTREKLEFDLSVIYESGKEVIANGCMVGAQAVAGGKTRWDFDMNQPMSSYLVALAGGDFKRKESVSESGVPLHFYYPEGFEAQVEPTYRFSEMMMSFMEKETGIPYPWQNYKQVPVRDFLYAGMENTGTTIFSDIFLVDSIGYHDRNYVMVNSHELAHQWFGNLVTATSSKHHWLQEGFATYYSLLIEKEIFGEEYFYWKLFQSADELKKLSDQGKGEAVLKAGASSLTYYQKGAWALHILKELIGKEAFDKAIFQYLQKYAFKSVTTEDFLAEVRSVSGKDLSDFKKNWLEQSAFQGSEALESLNKSSFIREYLEVAALKQFALKNKKALFEGALQFPVNDYIGQEVVYQLGLEETSEVLYLYKRAFASNNIYVRQAIALSLQQIPKELKPLYETLLDDASYVTQEAALFNLWINFPEDRTRYLQKMKDREGFLDKNIRILWLALRVATPQTGIVDRGKYLEELSSYTAPYHRFQVRQNAFNLLSQLNALQSQNVHDLLEASRHHNYRFREFAKRLLNRLIEEDKLLPEDKDFLLQKMGLKNSAVHK